MSRARVHVTWGQSVALSCCTFVICAAGVLALSLSPPIRLWAVVVLPQRDALAVRNERKVEALEAQVAELAANVHACRHRTDALRHVLHTLIGVWPGRAKLPDPPDGWAPWPDPGERRWDHAYMPGGIN